MIVFCVPLDVLLEIEDLFLEMTGCMVLNSCPDFKILSEKKLRENCDLKLQISTNDLCSSILITKDRRLSLHNEYSASTTNIQIYSAFGTPK